MLGSGRAFVILLTPRSIFYVMAKDAYYFSHDYNARNDERILELRSQFGAEGYGVFWMIVETMAENENNGIKCNFIGGLSLGYGVAIGRLQEIIECCKSLELFHEKDGYLFSKRLLEHKEFRKNLSENGVEGAKKRWGGYSPPNAKERKGKEKKEKGIAVSFSVDKTEAVFVDGSTQKLGELQTLELRMGNLLPKNVTLGKIE